MEGWDVLTEEFDVVASDGRQFHVQVHTRMTKNPVLKGPNPKPIKGVRTAKTTEGDVLTRIDDDNWIIVGIEELPVKRERERMASSSSDRVLFK